MELKFIMLGLLACLWSIWKANILQFFMVKRFPVSVDLMLEQPKVISWNWLH